MKKPKVLKPKEDAYGQELLAHYNGRRCREICERDDGYIEATLNPAVYFSSYEEWPPYEKKAMEFVHGRVLDIGCGAGRHTLYLQEKGFDVLGIDNSPLAIRVCKLRGVKNAKIMSIDDIDFAPNSFDTIIMMGNNFGLFGSFKNTQKLLQKFHRVTSKNASIIAETSDPYKTENPAHLEYQEFNRKRGRMSGQLRIRIRFRKYTTPWFDYLIVSLEEMSDILRGTDWKVKEFIDSENAGYVAIIETMNR